MPGTGPSRIQLQVLRRCLEALKEFPGTPQPTYRVFLRAALPICLIMGCKVPSSPCRGLDYCPTTGNPPQQPASVLCKSPSAPFAGRRLKTRRKTRSRGVLSAEEAG